MFIHMFLGSAVCVSEQVGIIPVSTDIFLVSVVSLSR